MTAKRTDSLAYFQRVGTPIVAVATALGGPVAILRVSGRDLKFLEPLVGPLPAPGEAKLRRLKSPETGEFLDEALVLYFRAPHSFSGEDVVEIQGHGVPALVERLQDVIVRLGAVGALPGEFSFRAVLNEKMTLEEASRLQTLFGMEGLGSSSASKLLSFGRSSEERVLLAFSEALDSVAAARGRVEAAIDFAEAEEEQSNDIASAEIRLREVERRLQALLNSYEVFSRNGRIPSVVLLGKPNAGKSTLLNLLVGGERSLVSEQAGTTRDYVEVQLRSPKGHGFRLLDTAGLRSSMQSADRIEAAGMALGLEMMKSADLLLWLQDARETCERFGEVSVDEVLASKPVLKILTHGDLCSEGALAGGAEAYNLLGDGGARAVRRILDFVDAFIARRGQESDALLQESAMVSQRQEALLREALSETRLALDCLAGMRPLELVGDHLRHLDSLLRKARGEGLTDDYIGQIFSQFCLGK